MAQPGSNSPVSSVEEFTQTSFDFIICGGGTAGLAIAARLSENPSVTVGIIEAGKYRIGDPLIDTPAAFAQMFENPEYDWCLYTAPQTGNNGRIHHLPRGKVVGGSSAINYSMYVRGSLQDYDDWAALVGDEGWSAASMQQYMHKHQTLEAVNPAALEATSPLVHEYHGTTGPVHTSFNEAVLPIEQDFVKACGETANLPNKPLDAWSGNHIGFYHTLGTVARTGPNKGKRSYAGRGYYEANRSRPNLKLLCEARVNKVILEGTKATGVSITYQGQEYAVSAKREVIVSGGTILSPQILELSGIGDPKVLDAAGVECKVENPGVGVNVQDHSLSIVMWETQPGVVSSDTLYQVPEAMQGVVQQYAETAGGPLSAIGSTQGFFPAKTILSESELAGVVQSIQDIKPTTPFHAQQLQQVIAHLESDISANLQLVLLPGTVNPTGGPEHQSQVFAPPPPGKPAGVTAGLCLQYPVSRGYIHIQSNDPTTPPVIQPNYITHEADTTVIAAFVRWADKMGRAESLKASIAGRSFPDPSVDIQDLEQAKQVVRDTVIGEYHICGSVALGDALDSRLRVKGTEGLRVADASVFPNNVSGNIVSSVYAIAEKAADLIKEDHGLF
ncbi:GMC oxidoreductase-domain-containing protein [Aspergillus cavernicola]|uniref:GMC oxidoreductase-domain-containing protein n=1 Tax=Aspergillus cavernicola TaxID=176166 RepID=A0ABR4I728_9EURO